MPPDDPKTAPKRAPRKLEEGSYPQVLQWSAEFPTVPGFYLGYDREGAVIEALEILWVSSTPLGLEYRWQFGEPFWSTKKLKGVIFARILLPRQVGK